MTYYEAKSTCLREKETFYGLDAFSVVGEILDHSGPYDQDDREQICANIYAVAVRKGLLLYTFYLACLLMLFSSQRRRPLLATLRRRGGGVGVQVRRGLPQRVQSGYRTSQGQEEMGERKREPAIKTSYYCFLFFFFFNQVLAVSTWMSGEPNNGGSSELPCHQAQVNKIPFFFKRKF